jgi:hypothetical protein
MAEKLCIVGQRALALVEKDQNVFHTYRWCGKEKRIYWFTLDVRNSFNEKKGKLDGLFDSRQLPAKYKEGDDPKEWIRLAIKDGYRFAKITH